MSLEPRRVDRPVAASESAGFAVDGPLSPHPSTTPRIRKPVSKWTLLWGSGGKGPALASFNHLS
jgi:hypothetical protein